MSKVYVYEPSENSEAEDTFELCVIAVSEESFTSGDYEEYEEEVLQVMEELGFMDIMVFSYQHETLPYEESLEILKNDPRIAFVTEPKR